MHRPGREPQARGPLQCRGGDFRRELDRNNGWVAGRFDASVRGFDPYPDFGSLRFGDPSHHRLLAPLTSAAVDLLTRKLNWRPDGSYELSNAGVRRAWDFGVSPPHSLFELRQILATDAKMTVLVGHGLFDLATPYFASQLVLDQLPAFAAAPRIKLAVYPGGHMFYSRDASRQAFRAEVEAMMKPAVWRNKVTSKRSGVSYVTAFSAGDRN
ncbi:carboxypeptidase C (cathepsin A) [Bradyrhizobium sp. LM3.2]